jgi:SAM-dependent methyltransferase
MPMALKRLLVPLWNGGHRLAFRAGRLIEAIARRRFDHCSVCGRFGPIVSWRGVVPPKLEALWGLAPRLAEALARKESCFCVACGAKLRVRRLARALLELYPVGRPPMPARSVRAWVEHPEVRALCVAEINRIEGLHDQLRRLPRFSFSDYREDGPPGTIIDGVRSEDLMRLSYPDASFDLVLTSETLEHIPDLTLALAEVRRVLRPGGRHLLTVPWLPGVPSTFARATIGPDGSLHHQAPPIRHPGGDVGYLVFHEFGADLPEILDRAGFEVDVRFGPPSLDDLGQVIVCRRRD